MGEASWPRSGVSLSSDYDDTKEDLDKSILNSAPFISLDASRQKFRI